MNLDIGIEVANVVGTIHVEQSCPCGKDSDFGVHGFYGGVIQSKYLCESCYHKDRRTHVSPIQTVEVETD